MTSLTCQRCGAQFTKTAKKGPPPRYCTSDCRLAARGRTAIRTHGESGYSHGCRCDLCSAAHVARMRQYQRDRGGNLNRDPETVRAYRERVGPARAKYPEVYRASDLRRRARKFTADAERFDSHEVFERDGWACGICNRAVNRELRYPHPKSASLDHIIPLSKGGAHTRANTHCAHLDCNMAKGNRGGNEQLLLIG